MLSCVCLSLLRTLVETEHMVLVVPKAPIFGHFGAREGGDDVDGSVYNMRCHRYVKCR